MTAVAWCSQCTFHFAVHSAQPITPGHLNPGTGQMCSGSGGLAIPGVS